MNSEQQAGLTQAACVKFTLAWPAVALATTARSAQRSQWLVAQLRAQPAGLERQQLQALLHLQLPQALLARTPERPPLRAQMCGGAWVRVRA